MIELQFMEREGEAPSEPSSRKAPEGRGSVRAEFTYGTAISRVCKASGGRGSVRADFQTWRGKPLRRPKLAELQHDL
jgi:hypothetical protein